MLLTAIFLLIIALIAGVFLAVYILFGNEQPPMPLALVHGGLAAAALILTILRAVAPAASMLLKVALAVLLLTAAGGFFLFKFQLSGKRHPKAVVVLHGILGVGGLVCLALAALGSFAA